MLLPLFLNDVAGSEIIVIILVVLIFFGSKSIPGIAKTLGKTLYQIKNASAELQNEIKKSGFDIKEDLKISNLIKEQQEEITRPMDQVYTEIENTIHYSSESISTEKIIPEKKVVIKEALKPTTKKVGK
ncbi:MAG: twin-arginine translocase TatA/TatE family subunit [Flavobacteriia bacterium]|nr:twin-arginine translocase TatA/TatE family subunit [Flavobacteriia bacterium]